MAELVPPGFILVPIEPTNAMLDACMERGLPYDSVDSMAVWKAMLDASVKGYLNDDL